MYKPDMHVDGNRQLVVSYVDITEPRFIISRENSRLKIPIITKKERIIELINWSMQIQKELAPHFEKTFIGNYHQKGWMVKIDMKVRVGSADNKRKETFKLYEFYTPNH